MPLDGTSYEKDEIAIVSNMQYQLREERFWCKKQLSLNKATHQVCSYGALNVADHGHELFITWRLRRVIEQFTSAAICPFRWRFKTRAAYNVHKRFAKLARRRLSWKFRLFPRFLISPGIIYNDLHSTTYQDIMGLLAEVKQSFQPRTLEDVFKRQKELV